MRVAIQQPEHMPWIGFFNKMEQCDLYVYLDNVQFKKRYFENRNRIKTKNGVNWLTVPVYTKGRYTQKINEVVIDNESTWIKRYMGNLEHAYNKAPFWNDAKNVFFRCLEKPKELLINLNLELIEQCRNYLQIKTPAVLSSSLNIQHSSGSDLLLKICLEMKADIYVSGPDGKNYLDIDEFQRNKIRVLYHDFKHPVYPQLFGDFVSHMSIVDLIANCGPESGKLIENSYRIKFEQ